MDSAHGGVIGGRTRTYWAALLALMLVVAMGSLGATSALAGTPPPANDNFANAQVLVGASGTATGTTVGATTETVEPPAELGIGGWNTIWYSFTAANDGGLAVDTLGTDHETILDVFTGSALGSLTQLAEVDWRKDLPQNRARLNVSAGQTYWIRVQSYFESEQGSITLNWGSVELFSNITGRVTDAITGKPVCAITVNVYAPDGSGGWSLQHQAYSNASGNYATDLLPDGSYRVGFCDQWGDYVPQYYSNKVNIKAADDVVVGGTANSGGIDAHLASILTSRFTLSYAAGSGGSVDGSTTQVVGYGDCGKPVTASPGVGYRFVSWDDGRSDISRTDTIVEAAGRSVTAVFAAYSLPTSVTQPRVSKNPRRSKKATFTAALSPGGATGSAKLYLSRWETRTVRRKVGRTWRKVRQYYWHTRAILPVRATSAGALSASYTFRYSGKWKAEVRFSGTAPYQSSTSCKTFTVR